MQSEDGQAALATFLFIVLLAAVGGLFWTVDYLELVDAEEKFYQTVRDVPYVGEYFYSSPISKQELQKEEIRRMRQQFDEREQELERRQSNIEQRSQRLQQEMQDIEQQREEIAQREKALLDRRNRFDDREQRVEYLAGLYGNMRPGDAAERLQNVGRDQIVISVLQKLDQDQASIILSNMDAPRASVLTRKMAQYPPN